MPWLLPVLQAAGFLLLRSGAPRDAFSSLLQIAASAVAAAYCGLAARRAKYVARTFWTLFALAFVAYAISAVTWAYFESWMGVPVPVSAISQFLYLCYDAPIVIALLLRSNGRSSGLAWPRALDFIQLLLICFLLYYDFLFLRAQSGGRLQQAVLEQNLSNALNFALAIFFVARSFLASTPLIRSLCRRMSAYMVVYTVAAAIADYAQTSAHTTSGSWVALAWTVPFALAATLAAGFRREPEPDREVEAEPVGKTFLWSHLALAVMPLTVWALAMRSGMQSGAVPYGAVFVSLVCYGSRLVLTQRTLLVTHELERKQTVELEKSLSLLRSTLESTADGILVVDRRGRVVDFNTRFQELWRIPPDLLARRDDESLLAYVLAQVADADAFIERVRYLYEHGEEDSFDVVKFRDGRILERYSRPQMTGAEIAGRVWSFRDVTEREQAQHDVAAWKDRYDAAVHASGLIIYDWNPATNAVHFGGSFEQILGYQPEEFLSPAQGWRKLIHPEDLPFYESRMDACLKSQEPFDVEYRVRRRDGQYRWLREHGRTVAEKDGGVARMFGFMTDVTEQRLLEQQLRQAQKMEAVGRLAGGVAHDFNNLLTVIAGYSELQLRSTAKTDPAHEQAEQIRAATVRAASLTRQLLAFSRQQVLQPKVVDLNGVVAEMDKMLRRIIGEHIEITTNLASDLGATEVDPGQIEQVLVNLVVNARDAMPQGGNLTIETTNVQLTESYSMDHVYVKPGRYVRLAVSDTGVGMDPQTRARLFEPFFTTKELGRGTGLGLATVYGIVKQSGGHAEVYSEPGRGTTFKIYFPLVNRPVTVSLPHVSPTSSGGTETILLVEDEQALRDMVTKVLTSRGYRVIPAASAEEAEQISSSNSTIDLLLTDVVMPRVSGTELGTRIAKRYPRIKVLYMSGYTANSMQPGQVNDLGHSFLEKPFTPQALAEKVREVLDTKQQ